MAEHENLDERLLHRVLFFTDAVFAIVMTLLVLELRPPLGGGTAEVGRPLQAMIGHFVAFVLSFAIAGVYWLAHLQSTRTLLRFDWPTAVVNLASLFPVCLIPFVSAWIGDSYGSAAGWGAYCAVMVATSIGGVALSMVESRGGGRLLAGGITPMERAHRAARAAIPGVAFGIGLIGLAAGQLAVAQYCWVLSPLLGVLLRTVWRPKTAAA